jgi:DNA adenine methylase
MRFLRYPGGKTKFLNFLYDFLPKSGEIKGTYIEPFVGGGSVFLFTKPTKAILSDINNELIELYKGIKFSPHKVWETFCSFPKGKKAYYLIRDSQYFDKPLSYRAARTLYLNRTCFKGMWRHNPNGNFNVGYGGESRRWAITHDNIIEISKLLKITTLQTSDFELVLEDVNKNDFIFLDPPYKPGQKELKESHYTYGKFTFNDQVRLSNKLKDINKKENIKWVMTNSSNSEIRNLYKEFDIIKVPKGVSGKIGIHTTNSQEILIKNF